VSKENIVWIGGKEFPSASLDMSQKALIARKYRKTLIQDVGWRVERHADELALGLTPTEPIEPVLLYIQALRDVPQQAGFPDNIEWPIEP